MTLISNRISIFFTRRVLARLLSTFLCCLALVVKPWSRFGGPSAFLILTLKELVFSAQESLAQHLEATILNITGALFGIGISTLARVIPAVFLVFITFLAGWAKSRLPRLQLSARISCFVSIWLLATNADVTNGSVRAATYFVWITLSAAFMCLVSDLLLLRWFSTHFARKIANAFSKLHECLLISMDETSRTDSKGEDGPLGTASRQQKLLDELLTESIQLDLAYSIAAFELRLGRISVESIKPLIRVVENTRRELSWGSSRAKTSHTKCPSHPTTTPAIILGQIILASMKHIEGTLLYVFERTDNPSWPNPPEKETTNQISHRLDQARVAARKELAGVFQHLNENAPKNENVGTTVEASVHSLFFVSLIEMADEMHHALLIANKIISLHDASRTRLWYPRLSLAWLGIAPPAIIDDDSVMPDGNDPECFEEHRLSLSELARWRETTSSATMSRTSGPKSAKPLLYIRNIIYGPRMIRLRVLFASCARAVAHSSHLQHAIKNSLGVALLSLPAFLPLGSPGTWAMDDYQLRLGTETNTGATWRVAYLRITGTMLGAVYAYLTWLICRTNPYGLVVMVTLADLPISWLITRTELSSLGVVASVTLPPIVFSRYLDANSDTQIITLAMWRAAMIAAGVLAALAMNTFVFPRHCRVLFLRNTSRTLGLLSQLYLTLSRHVYGHRTLLMGSPDYIKTGTYSNVIGYIPRKTGGECWGLSLRYATL
ncbi:hypothetical protein B0F90DRAFT_1711174 [Multifurca ochricompacta]|uniref:Integral membrane bound transporter domain-containing protein n=1 Tax=Multifurca ochricompacta TaxID=376703 RepID=A0AAD4M5V8_9AGAM|nr:hypothetical protein B0F90DRAFT_1711174 [Multifurca ochricompacta]